MAKQVNLSPTHVYERIRRLEREGIIKKYVALVEAEKVGKGLIVFCDIKLKEHTKEIGQQFVKDITASKYVCECYNISGKYDFRLKVMVKDMKHYQDFVLNDLGSIEKHCECPKYIRYGSHKTRLSCATLNCNTIQEAAIRSCLTLVKSFNISYP